MRDFFCIRQANLKDVPAITRIWLEGAKEAFGLHRDDQNYEDFFYEKVKHQNDVFQIWVAVDAGDIIGWQSLSPLTNNPIAHRLFAESSTYVSLNNRHRGVGRKLVEHALKFAQETCLLYVTAFVSNDNEKILEIVKQTGWTTVGGLPPSQKASPPLQISFIAYSVPPLIDL